MGKIELVFDLVECVSPIKPTKIIIVDHYGKNKAKEIRKIAKTEVDEKTRTSVYGTIITKKGSKRIAEFNKKKGRFEFI